MSNEKKTLDELLDDVSVLGPDVWENEDGPDGWYAVVDDTGIIAYFGREDQALFFRLALINAKLNDIAKKEGE